MRLTDPTEPEYVDPADVPGSPEWVKMRQEQTFKEGGPVDGGTRKFQPHRAPVKPKAPARPTVPGPFWPALALVLLLGFPVVYSQVIEAGEPLYVRVMSILFAFSAAWVLISWVRRCVIYLKNEGR